MNNYCGCQDNCKLDNDESRNMYAIDYDSLIERLTRNRNEIDEIIRILEHRKAKDSVINDILSQEDEDDSSSLSQEDEEIIKKILNNKTRISNVAPHPYYRTKYIPYLFF